MPSPPCWITLAVPGTSRTRLDGSRPFRGSSAMAASPTVVPSSAEEVLISSASAVTEIVSALPEPTFRRTSCVAERFAVRTMPFWR